MIVGKENNMIIHGKITQSKIFRTGKTKRDRSSGAHSRCIQNKIERASWQNDAKSTLHTFPWHTCNGKRNKVYNQSIKKSGKVIV